MALRRNLWQAFMEMVPKPFRNRYVVVVTAFFIWMFFFDSANILTQVQLGRSVEQLEEEKVYFQEKIEEAEADKEALEEDIEQFAREKYYMKKKEEEVFIFAEPEE
ncbi:MAG: septum formation initiator family protein [Bacteroidota bacterium]